jgi:DNA-binding protein H-NS
MSTKTAKTKAAPGAKAINFRELSTAQLKAFIERATAQLTETEQRERDELKSQVEELVVAKGFSLPELFGKRAYRTRGERQPSGKPGKHEGIVYVNPKDDTKVWRGKGRMPGWLAELVTRGKKLENFARAA